MTDSNYWTQFGRRRVSRRTALRGAGGAVLGLSGAALIGCGGGDDESDTTSTGSNGTATAGGTGTAAASDGNGASGGERTGTMRMALRSAGQALDPATNVSGAIAHWVTLGNLVVRTNKQTWELEGDLAESWEFASDTEIILHVRPDVFWHDKEPTNGRALDAEDLATSINRHAAILDPENAGLYHRRSNYVGLERAEVVDDMTVSLKLSQPSSAIMNGMADMRTTVTPRELLDIGFDDPNQFAGTGPWMVGDLNRDGGGSLVANPNYWEAGLPRAAQIDIELIDQTQATTAAFLGGSTDALSMINLPWTEVQTVAQQRSDAQQLVWDYGYMHYLRFNANRMQDVRIRKAMQLAQSPKTLGDGFYGELWTYSGPLTSAFVKEAYSADEIAQMPGWNPDTKEQDIAEARKMMDAAGYPNGELELTLMQFYTPVHPSNAERGRAQWRNVWPDMTINLTGPLESAPFFEQVAEGTSFDIMTYSQFPAPDAIVDLGNNYTPTGGRNYGKYENANVTDLIDRALVELDPDARTELAKQAQDILIEEAPMAPLYNARQVAFVDPSWEGIEGYPGPGGTSYHDIWEGTKLVTVNRS